MIRHCSQDGDDHGDGPSIMQVHGGTTVYLDFIRTAGVEGKSKDTVVALLTAKPMDLPRPVCRARPALIKAELYFFFHR